MALTWVRVSLLIGGIVARCEKGVQYATAPLRDEINVPTPKPPRRPFSFKLMLMQRPTRRDYPHRGSELDASLVQSKIDDSLNIPPSDINEAESPDAIELTQGGVLWDSRHGKMWFW